MYICIYVYVYIHVYIYVYICLYIYVPMNTAHDDGDGTSTAAQTAQDTRSDRKTEFNDDARRDGAQDRRSVPAKCQEGCPRPLRPDCVFTIHSDGNSVLRVASVWSSRYSASPLPLSFLSVAIGSNQSKTSGRAASTAPPVAMPRCAEFAQLQAAHAAIRADRDAFWERLSPPNTTTPCRH